MRKDPKWAERKRLMGGKGASKKKIYRMQERARRKAEAERAAKEAAWQKAADNATVTSEGGYAENAGALSKAQTRKRGGTLAGAGESTFSPKASTLGE